MEKWFVYILKSQKDSKLYVGISKNPAERLKEHNSGKTFSTRTRKPFTLIYSEEHPSRKQAREREKYLKSYSGAKEKQRLVESTGE